MRIAVCAVVLVVGCASASNLGDAGKAPDASPIDAALDSNGDAEPNVPDIDSIPWTTGSNVGYGVASKDTQNPLGNSMFIAYAGYGVDLAHAEAWATALYRADLRARGVRRIWAVQGPADPGYTKLEIGNSKIAAALVPLVDGSTHFILAAAHSSGAFVAWELFEQLANGADEADVTKDRIVFFDLDGGGGFAEGTIDRLHKAYFVGSHEGTTLSPNHAVMASLGSTYASKGGFWDNDAAGAGCNSGAEWCVHMTLITSKPHDPANAYAELDYSDFAGRPVVTSYIDAKATEAGL